MKPVAGPASPDVIDLDSSQIVQRDRIAVLREAWGRAMIGFDLSPRDDATDLEYRANIRRLDNSAIYSATGSPLVMHRLPRQLEDGKDAVSIIFSDGESTAFDDKGSEYRVAGKQAVIMSMARSHGMINNGGRGLSSSIHIRRNALKELVPNLDDAPVALVPESTRGLALLRSYAMLIVNDPLSTSDIRHAADEHLVHLFAIVAGATGDALDFAVANGVAAGRLRAIKADILQQLADPSLNLEIVAARHGITTRHVQRLFEREGTSFSGFLGEARLSCAHGKLTNRNYAGVSILSIAFECGFADISTFNRAFRRAYGMTPSEARNMGR